MKSSAPKTSWNFTAADDTPTNELMFTRGAEFKRPFLVVMMITPFAARDP